ncbi:MAG: SPOR domain-containing protein [Parvularculaceae bacterium]
MKSETASFDDDFEELDDFEDDDDDRGLSGLVVLLMGTVIIGAIVSVIWIAYQHGVKAGEALNGSTPYVTADPEPLKIENKVADAAGGADNVDREVYDQFDGAPSDPVEVIASGPEEPLARDSDDPIAAIATDAGAGAGVVEDAVADRIAELAAADAALTEEPAPAVATPTPKPDPKPATTPTPASVTPAPQPSPKPEPKPATTPTVSYNGDALSGSHLVQVGAFRSEAEADGQWTKLQGKLGDYLAGKSDDVERADLGAKGVYYRLRIGPFASADDAKTYCAGLKDRGTDCLIKAK